MAKDNVVKIGTSAAQQATELTKNVNEKVKDGNLFSSFSTAGSKAFTSIGSYISSDQISNLTNSASSFFGRVGYNSVPGETGQNAANTSTNLFSDDSNDRSPNQKQQQQKQNQAARNLEKDDWSWDSNWESSKSKNSSNANSSSINKSKSKDLMNFEDDQWETIEPSKSK